MAEDYCVCCGAVIPEGGHVCPNCINKETGYPLQYKGNKTYCGNCGKRVNRKVKPHYCYKCGSRIIFRKGGNNEQI